MYKIICPKCKTIIVEGPECESSGVISCNKCGEQLIWKFNGKDIFVKVFNTFI